jgi:hypothetical protein
VSGGENIFLDKPFVNMIWFIRLMQNAAGKRCKIAMK